MADIVNTIFSIAVFLIGVYINYRTTMAAVRTFVLPRSDNVWLTRFVFRTMNLVFRFWIKNAKTYEERDHVMAFYAPISLLTLPVAWLSLVLLGYSLMFWAIGIRPMSEAFNLSGSSLLTLGFRYQGDFFSVILEFSEAILGLILVALLIAYLPTMYAAFSRREAAVGMLEVRAGSPPSAQEMIARYHRLHGLQDLNEIWRTWEMWFNELEESHTSLAPLIFFRSIKPHRSWIISAGAVLDAAAITSSTLDIPRQIHADLCIRAGYLALRSIADFFSIPYNATPQKDDPISIAKDEFDAMYDELVRLGIPVKPDREQCWRDFAGWRVNYDRVLLALAALTMAPYAPWSSDRSLPRTDMRHKQK